PVLRTVYDQMSDPKWVISMGVCASSGGMFNNYAIVQGVDHILPVDSYLPGCPPRPEMLINSILEPHNQVIKVAPLAVVRAESARRVEEAALRAEPTHEMMGPPAGASRPSPARPTAAPAERAGSRHATWPTRPR